MATKHTPGPWKVMFMHTPRHAQIDTGENDFFVEAENNNTKEYGMFLEIMQDDYGEHNGYPRAQRLADAKLIAAAPELLAALYAVDDYFSVLDKNAIDVELHAEVRAAIRKATGYRAKESRNRLAVSYAKEKQAAREFIKLEEVQSSKYDEYVERHGEDSSTCYLCGKKTAKELYVHYTTGGYLTSLSEEQLGEGDDEHGQSQGYFPVGPECAKKLPKNYITPQK